MLVDGHTRVDEEGVPGADPVGLSVYPVGSNTLGHIVQDIELVYSVRALEARCTALLSTAVYRK